MGRKCHVVQEKKGKTFILCMDKQTKKQQNKQEMLAVWLNLIKILEKNTICSVCFVFSARLRSNPEGNEKTNKYQKLQLWKYFLCCFHCFVLEEVSQTICRQKREGQGVEIGAAWLVRTQYTWQFFQIHRTYPIEHHVSALASDLSIELR